MRRSEDWLRQAEVALKQVKDSLENGNYWASCFFHNRLRNLRLKLCLHRGV